VIEWLFYRRGCWRIYWGACPVCNSDAPALDTCQFCKGHREWRDKKARRELRQQWDEVTGNGWKRFWV